MSEQNQNTENTKQEGEKVQVDKDKLAAMLKRLDRLESAANKAHLGRYDSLHRDTQRKIIQLNVYEGQVIKRWSGMLRDKVEKNPKTGVWEEDQVLELTFMDNTKKKIPYVIFARRYQHINAEVLKETKNLEADEFEKYGQYTFEVKTVEGGKRYTIGHKFVN